jgi:predicted transcriptional regulator
MGEYQLTQIDYIFEAVAHPARRAILEQLTKSDARVTELASSFTISLNSTSKHIKILERAGLVPGHWRRPPNGSSITASSGKTIWPGWRRS